MDVDQSATVIREIVAKEGEITGALLAAKLRALDPGWNAQRLGAKSLRLFVEEHVPGVTPASRSGMDLVYTVQDIPPLPKPKKLWTTWVSPFSPFSLMLDPATGHVDQLPCSAPLPKGMERLTQPSQADHLEFAKEFLTTTPDAPTHLATLLVDPKRQWWRQWYSDVKKADLLPQWRKFRQHKLEGCLRVELASRTNDEALATMAFSTVVRTKSSDDAPTTAMQRPGTVTAIRRALIEGIEQLSDDEIRVLSSVAETVAALTLANRSK